MQTRLVTNADGYPLRLSLKVWRSAIMDNFLKCWEEVDNTDDDKCLYFCLIQKVCYH